MECPVCHKMQIEVGSECQFCGVVFEKWYAKMGLETPDIQDSEPSLPEMKKNPPAAFTFSPIDPARRPLLETSSADVLAYRVNKEMRTLCGLLLFFVDPSVRFIHALVSKYVQFSPYAVISTICFLTGIYIGMVARKRDHSEILTAGGAGFLGGTLRSISLYLPAMGTLTDKLKVSLPIFGIYSAFTFLGGILSWVLRKYFDIKLD